MHMRVKMATRGAMSPGSNCGKKRNLEPPLISCEVCGKPATEVCAGEHECGEEMLLPVVNSPRVGMCGYTGPV
jgi:hypothetical protein